MNFFKTGGYQWVIIHGRTCALEPVVFEGQNLSIAQQPASQLSIASSPLAKSVALAAQRIPGVQPGLKILSPKPGQTFTGSVPLEVEITGWQGVPRVDLAWWWSPGTPQGQWPATPQGMTVMDHLKGQTRTVIPRAAFSQSGVWRVKAAVKLSDTQQVIDAVAFTLADTLKPMTPKQVVPGKAAHTPAATQNVQVRPASPTGKAGAAPTHKSILPKQ